MNYFIIINDAQQGPFSVAELQQKGIGSETLVWTEGMAEWTPAWQVEELRPIFYKQTAGAAVPPPPPVGSAAATQAAPADAPAPQQAAPAESAAAQAAPESQTPKPRHNGRWAVIVLVVVALVLAFTNPSEKAHKRAILSNVTNGISELTGGDNGNPIAQGLTVIGQMFAGGMVQMMLEQNLEYHNYLFFSTTSLHLGSHDVRTSMGFLGNVFTAGKNDVANQLKKVITDNQGDDDADASDTGADTRQAPGQDVQSSEQDTTMTTIAGHVGEELGRAVAKEVTKKVKQQVSESTDSTTSNGVSRIIDEIEKMIGL